MHPDSSGRSCRPADVPSIPVEAAISVLLAAGPRRRWSSGLHQPPQCRRGPCALIQPAIDSALELATTTAEEQASLQGASVDLTLTFDTTTMQIAFGAEAPPGKHHARVVYTLGAGPGIGNYLPSFKVKYIIEVATYQPDYAQIQFDVAVDACVELTGLSPLLADEKMCGATLPTCDPFPSGSVLSPNFAWALCYAASTGCGFNWFGTLSCSDVPNVKELLGDRHTSSAASIKLLVTSACRRRRPRPRPHRLAGRVGRAHVHRRGHSRLQRHLHARGQHRHPRGCPLP